MGSRAIQETLLVHGYIREHVSSRIFPVGMIGVIFDYFQTDTLEWDIGDNAGNDELIKANNLNEVDRVKHSIVEYSIITAKDIITSALCNVCYFEIQIIECEADPAGSNDLIDMMIGFLKHPKEDALKYNPSWIGGSTKEGHYSVYLYPGYTFLSINASCVDKLQPSSMNGWRLNDRIGFEIDFVKSTASVYYNDECLGVAFENIPNAIIPAVSMFYKDMAICCSRLEYKARRS